MRVVSLLVFAAAIACAAQASAQEVPRAVPAGEVEIALDGLAAGAPPEEITVVVDADDDDENGAVDAVQTASVPLEDCLVLTVRFRRPLTVRVDGGLRLVRASGAAAVSPLTLARREMPARLGVQGVRASSAASDGAIVVESDGREVARIRVTVVAIAFLHGDNEPLDARTDALSVSHAITNDASLARTDAWASASRDPDDVRLEIFDPRERSLTITAILSSAPPGPGRPMSARPVVLQRRRPDLPFRSPWLRLVGDVMDEQAPGVGHRVLRVGLRHVVRASYGDAPGVVAQSLRVGRPGDEDGPNAARRAQLRLRILRHRPGGTPVIGGDEQGALRIAREQVRIANEIWLQCGVDFGPPGDVDVAVVDPPPPSMVSVSDGDGLPARGGGVIRLRAGGRAIRPVQTRPGALPIDTAVAIARALSELGLSATVTENPPAELGAGRSADVLARDASGALVTLGPDGDAPSCTDGRQTVTPATVDLDDGLQEFDNMTAAAGTLEERALYKALADDDPSTIELFVVNRFTAGTRQGEAFIEADGTAVVNAVILDRNGVRQEREAWTQSHEIGHVLLDQPFHPDNVGPDRPWLLMDADSSQGLVTGPKRLSPDECHRVRARSGALAVPALLRRLDARPTPPEGPFPPFDPGYPRR